MNNGLANNINLMMENIPANQHRPITCQKNNHEFAGLRLIKEVNESKLLDERDNLYIYKTKHTKRITNDFTIVFKYKSVQMNFAMERNKRMFSFSDSPCSSKITFD